MTVHCQDDLGFHFAERGIWTEGTLRTVTLDLCPKCFEEKLAPWFMQQGGNPRVNDDAWGDLPSYGKPDLNETVFAPNEIRDSAVTDGAA